MNRPPKKLPIRSSNGEAFQRYHVLSPTPSLTPPTKLPSYHPNTITRPGGALRTLLGCNGCSGDRIVNLMNKHGVGWCQKEENRNYIAYYIKTRWAQKVMTLQHEGKLTSVDPYTELVDLAISTTLGHPSGEKVVHSVSRPKVNKAIKWAVGVTTVPSRISTLLPRTLSAIEKGGFDKPHLFVDDCPPRLVTEYLDKFGLNITARYPKIGAYGNWICGMHELFLRSPEATRFVMFQDDIVMCQNVRHYLDTLELPEKSYINLSTAWENEPVGKNARVYGLREASKKKDGKYRGRGALGLVFSRDCLISLLRHPHLSNRVLPDQRDPSRYRQFIDGAVVEAANNLRFRELIHIPSLVQHNGPESTITKKTWGPQVLAKTFPGERWDAMSLLASDEEKG